MRKKRTIQVSCQFSPQFIFVVNNIKFDITLIICCFFVLLWKLFRCRIYSFTNIYKHSKILFTTQDLYIHFSNIAMIFISIGFEHYLLLSEQDNELTVTYKVLRKTYLTITEVHVAINSIHEYNNNLYTVRDKTPNHY